MTENGDKNGKTTRERSKKALGLCANCINYKYCSYAKRATKPVLFCEEYDVYSKLAEKYDLEVKKGLGEKKSKK